MVGEKIGKSSSPKTTIKLYKMFTAKQLFQSFGIDQRHTTNLRSIYLVKIAELWVRIVRV